MLWQSYKEIDMTQLELFPSPDLTAENRDDVVFCWFFRHWKTGQIVRAKNGHPFCFVKRR